MGNYNLNKSVVFVGLMGAGKSSVAKRLSEEIDIPFVDSDHEIELAAGMTVMEIFEQFGESYFRSGEERVLERLLTGQPQIIATGGGAFMSEKIRSMITLNGVSVWLRADFETLWERVQGKKTRPLLQVTDPQKTLRELIKKRTPIYEIADIILDSKKNGTHSSVVSKLINLLTYYGNLERTDGKEIQ